MVVRGGGGGGVRGGGVAECWTAETGAPASWRRGVPRAGRNRLGVESEGWNINSLQVGEDATPN